jgi:hypothetical protein
VKAICPDSNTCDDLDCYHKKEHEYRKSCTVACCIKENVFCVKKISKNEYRFKNDEMHFNT